MTIDLAPDAEPARQPAALQRAGDADERVRAGQPAGNVAARRAHCPDCATELWPQGRCLVCPACGWGACA